MSRVSAEPVWSMLPGARFDLGFVGADGRAQRESLSQCWGAPFEYAMPARSFLSYKGQKNFTGFRWTATTGRHVGFESWLERDNAMLLDFDPLVVGLSSQPFVLFWRDGRRERRHTPDYFARLADGSGLVVDVKPDRRVKGKAAEAFAVTGQACEEVGWTFRRVGELDPVYRANVRWLACYRHPRNGPAETVSRVLEAFAQPTSLFAGASAAGVRLAVLPVVYHLLWRQVLAVDLRSEPLNSSSVVWRNTEGTI